MVHNSSTEFILPVMLVGPADINRTLLELQMVDDVVRQAALSGSETPKLPKTSRLIDSLAEANRVDLADQAERDRLIAFMESLQQHAPVLHISFAAEPSADFTAKIIAWLRQNISKYVLVHIGLQPSIAAGCIIRSTNKVFDLSLRRHLEQKRSYLMDLMQGVQPVAAGPRVDPNGTTGAQLSPRVSA